MMKAFNTHYYHFNYILMKNKFFELKMIINLSNPILMMNVIISGMHPLFICKRANKYINLLLIKGNVYNFMFA